MVRDIENLEDVRAFARSFQGDRVFADPHLSSWDQYWGNLERAFQRKDSHRVLGVYRDGAMIGLFSLLVLPEEAYLEMLSGLSREEEAYAEILEYISRLCPGYHADIIYNPNNAIFTALLKARGAEFDTVQNKMIYSGLSPACDSAAVVPYSEEFREDYFRIHDDSTGRYWTAEKTLAAPDRFRVFLALHEGQVAGYIDVTHCFDENEPYDVFVSPEYRRQGLGRALLARALAENEPKAMMLLVDEDNAPAIALYESMGFVSDEAGRTLLAVLAL